MPERATETTARAREPVRAGESHRESQLKPERAKGSQREPESVGDSQKKPW